MNKLTDQIQAEVNKVVLGKEDIVRKVLLAILAQGHVLLEEHSPHGIGNHAVILTECQGIFQNARSGLQACPVHLRHPAIGYYRVFRIR